MSDVSEWLANGGGRGALIAAAIGIVVGGGGVAAVQAVRGQDVGEQVRAYLLEHPEVLPEAMARLQARDTGRQVAAHRAELETPYQSAWAGNPKGDVTLVQFFDYACTFCRASVPDLERLLAEDRNLRIVFRELPILGVGSQQAAAVSLVAAKQGKFLPFHRAMYAAGPPDSARIQKVSAATGIDTAAMPGAEVTREIGANMELARTLDLTGTPAFIVGDRILNGAVGYDALKQAIAETRAKRG